MAEIQTTGIKNADELTTLAAAFGLTVTVETTDRETLTSYVVRFETPVPAAYAGTELGRTIAGDTMTLLWTKAKKKGARGCLVDATVWSVADHRKVRTLRDVTAAVETLGRSSAKYARDAAPLPEDVVDAPHALYIDGELRKEGIPAERVRTFVKNRRFNGLVTHQDDDGGIVCDNRRYVPVATEPAPAEETPAATEERKHVRIANGGTPEILPSRLALKEINHAMMDGKRDVREMSASYGHARIVYRDQRGTVELRRATAEDLAAYAPETTAPVAAPPLFAALAAYEATVLCTSPRDLEDLTHHLRAVGKAAPTEHHLEIVEAHADVEEAWEALRAAGDLRARNAAHDQARAAVERARAVILAVAPNAHRMHGTDMPSTAEEVRAAAVAYNAVGSTAEELSAVETGTPQVRVYCSSDSGSGWTVTATIAAGVDTPQGFLPAHPAIIAKFRRRDGREDAAANARKVIGALFNVAVPVEYVRRSHG